MIVFVAELTTDVLKKTKTNFGVSLVQDVTTATAPVYLITSHTALLLDHHLSPVGRVPAIFEELAAVFDRDQQDTTKQASQTNNSSLIKAHHPFF